MQPGLRRIGGWLASAVAASSRAASLPAIAAVVGLAGCGGSVTIGPIGPVPRYDEPTPLAVATALRFDGLGIGHWHSCMLGAAGDAWCWGSNEVGQLGAPSTARCMDDNIDCSATPLRVLGPADYVGLAPNHVYTCALTRAGSARCWGFGLGGQLGDGRRADSLAPVDVAGGHRFEQLAAALWGDITCGLKADGRLWCWGIGLNSVAGPAASAAPADWAAANAVVWAQVAIGEAHLCGLDAAGSAWCLGRNRFGELGDGSDADAAHPVPVAGGHRFQAITVGPMHSCGLDLAGAAWCWGLGAAVGDGAPADTVRREPVAVAGGHRFVQLAAGALRTCGLTAAGAAWCWGDGEGGGVGDGRSRERLAPVAVTGGHVFAAIGVGGMASCGLTPDGQAWCWGWNETGALGVPIVAH
jgi:alpha-tubulin suppressor-like RCC1 family protein